MEQNSHYISYQLVKVPSKSEQSEISRKEDTDRKKNITNRPYFDPYLFICIDKVVKLTLDVFILIRRFFRYCYLLTCNSINKRSMQLASL